MYNRLRKWLSDNYIRLHDIVSVKYPWTNYIHIGKVIWIRLYDWNKETWVKKYVWYKIEWFDLEIYNESYLTKEAEYK